ncbi:MAG: helix-turn-helix domain-containing protein [Lachnospiraceae bacterium]|nr:helix-turn-helix domain-containing protein [Lachnospiraceae bacterium]
MEIGKKIRALRLEKEVKQEELAQYLGVSVQAVSKWETGSSVPDISLLPNLAIFFGVTIDELFQLSDEAWFERIENMFRNERRIAPETFEHCVKFLEGVLRNEPRNVRAYSCLAYLYNHRAHSDHEIASEYAKKVLDLDPEDKSGWVAYLEANNGVCGDEWYDNHFEVTEYFKEFLKKNPGNYRGLYAIIENLLKDGWYDEAVPYIEQMRTAANTHQYYVYTGDVMLGKGDPEKAISWWNAGVEHFPGRWQAYCDRADRFKKLGRYEEALADYEKCFEMQEPPRISDGLYSMAQLHERLGDFQAAVRDRQRIIKCLREEYETYSGESIDEQKREIERLKRRSGAAK